MVVVKRLTLVVALVLAGAACDGQAPARTAAAQPDNAAAQPDIQLKPVVQSRQAAAAASPAWSGEARGHVENGDPMTDTVAFLVGVGSVHAHWNAYSELANGRKDQGLEGKTIASAIGDEVYEVYGRLEARAAELKPRIADLRPSLDALTSPDMVAQLDAPGRRMPADWGSLRDHFKVWADGLIESVPGRHTRQILLARSALLRKAGEAFAGTNPGGAVQAEGAVTAAVGDGFIDSAIKVSRMALSLCEKQSVPLRETREATTALRIRLYEGQADPGDVFDLAAQVESRAADLAPDGGDC